MINKYFKFFCEKKSKKMYLSYYYMDLLLKIKSKKFAKGVKFIFEMNLTYRFFNKKFDNLGL